MEDGIALLTIRPFSEVSSCNRAMMLSKTRCSAWPSAARSAVGLVSTSQIFVKKSSSLALNSSRET